MVSRNIRVTTGKKYLVVCASGKSQLVIQRDRLQNGDDLMIIIRSLAENTQVPIDLCEGGEDKFRGVHLVATEALLRKRQPPTATGNPFWMLTRDKNLS